VRQRFRLCIVPVLIKVSLSRLTDLTAPRGAVDDRPTIDIRPQSSSPFVIWRISPLLSRNASVRKGTAQLTGALADWLMAALQCGGGPHYGCTLRYECPQSFVIFGCPWLREQLHLNARRSSRQS
jgi:hypothetical protein